MNATIVDLRYRMKDVLRALDRGETVTVSYRGKKKARLLPIEEPSESPRTSDVALFGLWKDRIETADPGAFVRAMRALRPVSSIARKRASRRAV